MIALASILSLLPFMKMPFGGSITAGSMLPILIIAFRRNTSWGLLTGLAFALIQCIMGLDNLSYATSWKAAIAIIMLDYILAFTFLGLGGIFKNRIKDDGAAMAMGALLCCIIRYVCHVISGCTVWAGVSIPDTQGLIFSLGYNAAYMLPEAVLTIFAAYFVGKSFDIKSQSIKRRVTEKSGFSLLGTFIFALALIIDALFLFKAMQSEDGFDITLVAKNAEWLKIAVVSAVGVVGAIAANVYKGYKNSEK